MGQEIVYCTGCQSRLVGSDFEKGLAFRLKGYTYCASCAPEEAKTRPEAAEPARDLSATARIRLGTSASRVSNTTRRMAIRQRSNPFPIVVGCVVGGVVLVVLVIILAGGSSPSRKAREPQAQPVNRDTGGAPKGRAEEVLNELKELLSKSKDPTAVLLRCDEVKGMFRGTPLDLEFQEIEQQARQMKAAIDDARKVEVALQQAREMMETDPEFRRKEDILGMLEATLKIAGSRRPEVERVLREFREAAAEAEKKESERAAAEARAGIVLSLYLVNVKTKEPVPGFDPIREGAVIDLSKFPAVKELDLRARVRGDNLDSVRYDLDGEKHRIEDGSPYDLDGGKVNSKKWAQPGRHTVVATPYSENGAKGEVGWPLRITFTVVKKAP